MDIKRQLIKAGREMAQASLVSGVSGNISVRQGKEITITSSGSNFSHLTGHDLAIVDLEGNRRSVAKPSDEVNMHLEIYKAKADVFAIVSAHSVFATVLSCLNQPLIEVNPEEGIFSGVKIIPLNKDKNLTINEAVKYLSSQPAVIIEKRGAVVVGSNLNEAVDRAFAIEEIAKITYFVNLQK